MNEQDFAQLNDYFNDLLSPEQARAVEGRANEDAEFGQEFSLRQQMEDFPRRTAQRKIFAETLTAVGADFFQEKEMQAPESQRAVVVKINWQRWLAVAASLALAVAAVWFFASPVTPTYRQYAGHVPLSLTVRGAADQAASEAETAFNEKNWSAALPALDRVLAEAPDNLTAQLYKGICLLELDRASEARAVFQPIANRSSALRTEADWYTALSYLKEKNTVACQSELLKIPPGDIRYDQAQELLKLLK